MASGYTTARFRIRRKQHASQRERNVKVTGELLDYKKETEQRLIIGSQEERVAANEAMIFKAEAKQLEEDGYRLEESMAEVIRNNSKSDRSEYATAPARFECEAQEAKVAEAEEEVESEANWGTEAESEAESEAEEATEAEAEAESEAAA